MPPPLRRRTPKTTVLYAAMSASSSPSTATPARGAATREAGSPRPLPKLERFPQIADCQATPSLRPNAHTEVRLIDSVDVARGSGQHGSSRALAPLRYRGR